MTVRSYSQCNRSVFISYSTEDDKAWNNWISCFTDELGKSLPGRLKRIPDRGPDFSGDDQVVAGQLSRQLCDRIAASFAMFIFVHDNYNESAWCLKELAHFKSLFGDDGFRDRLYVIAMSRPAIEELTSRDAWKKLCPFDDQVWNAFFRDDHEDHPHKIYASQIKKREVVTTEFWDPFVLVREDLASKIRESVANEPRAPAYPDVAASAVARAQAEQPLVRVYIESIAEQEKYAEWIGSDIVASWDEVISDLRITPALYLRPTGLPMTELDKRPLLDDADGVVLLWNRKTPDAVAAQIKKVEPKLMGPRPAPGLIAYVMESAGDRPDGDSVGNWKVVRFAPRGDGVLLPLPEDLPILKDFLRGVLARKRG